MKDLVSVIVPVYNVADYLDECLNSIINQTYQNIEIILINDGSTDNSPQICEQWVQRDKRILYISKQNERQGPTRNLGVRLAKGEYIMFVDSDDWVDNQFVEKMFKSINNCNADMAECDFYRIAVDSGIKSQNINNQCMGKIFNKEERIILGNVSPCKTIYHRNFLINNNIKQPISQSEDLAVYALEVILANKIDSLNEPLYYYRKFRPNATTFNKEVFLQSHLSMQYLIDSFKQRCIFEKYEAVLMLHLLQWSSRMIVPCLTKVSYTEYKSLIKSFEEFFKRNFSLYTNSKVTLIGGYNLTKIVQFMPIIENPYLRFQFTSLAAIMSARDDKINPPHHRNPYRRYMLNREFNRSFFDVLDEEKPEYIVIDFIEERHNLLEYNGVIYTKSDALIESDFPVEQARNILRDSDEGWLIWENACSKFINELQKRFKPHNIILIENLLTERHGDIYQSTEFDSIEDIRRMNNILRRSYDFFKLHCPNCQHIDMTEDSLYITDDQYEYGCHPWHLNKWINAKIGLEIKFDDERLMEMSKIKILQFPIGGNATSKGGGITQYVLNNWNFIDRERFQFDFATMLPELSMEDELRRTGSEVYKIKTYAEDNNQSFYDTFYNILKKGKYDIVHLHTSQWRSTTAEKAAKAAKVPRIIIHAHNTYVTTKFNESTEYLYNFHKSVRDNLTPDLATDYWACSRAAADFLYGDKIPQNKIKIMYNAIDLDKFSYDDKARINIRRELNLSESEFVIGHVGRFVYQKNQEFILRVMKLLKHNNISTKLVLVGSGEDEEVCHKYVLENDLTDIVQFIGYRKDVNKLLSAFDLFVLPSRFEGLPVGLIEAQTSGIQCIVSDKITREVKITDNVDFLPLDENLWSEAIINQVNKRALIRCDTKTQITRAGYNIREQIKVLEQAYLNYNEFNKNCA